MGAGLTGPLLRRAAGGGELPPDADSDGLADLCITVMQGGMLVTKLTRSPDAFRRAAGHALAYVRSLRRTPSQVSDSLTH